MFCLCNCITVNIDMYSTNTLAFVKKNLETRNSPRPIILPGKNGKEDC